MSNIKMAEELIFTAVERQEMEIDPEGRIWRIAKRGWDRWRGEVRTNRCERVRAETLLPSGYLMVRAMVDRVRLSGLAHRLVWRQAHGALAPNMVINHKNGQKADNRLANLELVTRSENARHAVRVLRVGPAANQCGERNPAARLTAEQVEAIRARRASGERLRTIASDFGVAIQTVSKIARGNSRNSG